MNRDDAVVSLQEASVHLHELAGRRLGGSWEYVVVDQPGIELRRLHRYSVDELLISEDHFERDDVYPQFLPCFRRDIGGTVGHHTDGHQARASTKASRIYSPSLLARFIQ